MKILGLDLGTNSLGWAVVDDEKEGNKIQDKGVLIFSEGVKKEKGQEKSKAAERTTYRSARRLKFRRKIRKYQTLLVLAKNGMCPLKVEEVKEWRKSNFKKYPMNQEFLEWLGTKEKENINPYYFRYMASREKVTKFELGRALYHIAQRRGFLSNRLDQSDKGIIEKYQPDLETLINDEDNLNDLKKSLDEFFIPFDIIEKKSKDLNAGEDKLRKLYNNFISIMKENLSLAEIKSKLLDRLDKNDNLGEVKKGITKLDKAINNPNCNCKTLGQYFWKLYKEDRNNKENKIRNNYTSREEHYLSEFEIICETQELDGIDKTKKDANKRYSGVVKELYKAIFYQRPLKSQKGLIGKCSLEPKRTRCSVSRPEFEQFRMFSFINSIKLKFPTDEKFRFLHKDEKEQIIPKFYRKSKPTFPFEDLKNILGKDNIYNFKDKTTVSGCPTIASLINVFGNDWENIVFQNYTDKLIRSRKTKEIIREKTKEEVIGDIWHVLSTFTSDDKLYDFAIKKLMLDKDQAGKFASIHLKKDYVSLSLFAINKILPYLKKGLLYSHAVFMANMDRIIDADKWENKETRNLIEKEIGEIIDNHQEENKALFAVNSLLKKCFDEHFNYSQEAEKGYKIDLEGLLKKEFGEKSWEKKADKNEILEDNFQKFINSLEERKYIAVRRIDEKIFDFIVGKNDRGEIFCSNESLVKKIYHPSDIEKFKPVTIKDESDNEYKGLGSPDIGSIKNPMAMRALYLLRKLVNTLIKEGKIDENTKINIELARELNDANKRKAIERWQNDRKELYEIYEAKIKELYPKENNGKTIDNITDDDLEKFRFALEQREDGKIVSKDDILKYTLWEEQKHICIYTGKTISLSAFLDKNPQFDIEHTIPRSISMDDSQKNKTLCDSKFNRDIKGNKIPFELNNYNEILPRIKHWKEKYESLHDEIENLKRQSRNASDKEQKDRLVQKRHYLQMDYYYWKSKYDRFTMEEVKEGFKNSQFIDTGIITKYAVAYMKSVFKKVYSVKGEMVDQYRKAWGVNITKIDEKTGRAKKNRDNHIHHCVDAVTIACMNKGKYDKLAHSWGLEEDGDFEKAKKELENEKPWDTFTHDVRNLKNEVFIVHHDRDVLPVQTKKKFKKRGKIQYRFVENLPKEFLNKKEGKDYFVVSKNENKKYKIPIFQQGDTVRGALHQETFYGAIAHDINGNINKDEDGNIIPNYVVRKELSKLKRSDISNIVDKSIREIVKQAADENLISFNNNGAKVNGKIIWQNKEKQIPLKKVRIYTSVKSPLKDFKKHAAPFLSDKKYKQQFNVVNDENYCMAIYEGVDNKGKIKRDLELVNNIDAGEYYKLSNKNHKVNHPLVPDLQIVSNLPLKYILKKGQMILRKNKNETIDDILSMDLNKQLERLFIIVGIDKDGIKVCYHNEARPLTDLVKFMKEIINQQNLSNNRLDKNGKIKESKITGPVGGIKIGEHKKFPYQKFKPSNFNAFIVRVDFEISPTGVISKL